MKIKRVKNVSLNLDTTTSAMKNGGFSAH